MLFDKSTILAVQHHVITRNPRISVSHDKHRTWYLHIKNVREEDKGKYMCQINTITSKTQYGYLHVVGKSVLYIYHSCDTIFRGCEHLRMKMPRKFVDNLHNCGNWITMNIYISKCINIRSVYKFIFLGNF